MPPGRDQHGVRGKSKREPAPAAPTDPKHRFPVFGFDGDHIFDCRPTKAFGKREWQHPRAMVGCGRARDHRAGSGGEGGSNRRGSLDDAPFLPVIPEAGHTICPKCDGVTECRLPAGRANGHPDDLATANGAVAQSDDERIGGRFGQAHIRGPHAMSKVGVLNGAEKNYRGQRAPTPSRGTTEERRWRTSAISRGTISSTLPTRLTCAILRIGAWGSELMATMTVEFRMPRT